ncbi:MAG TPA: aldo/keto reductase [Verrucomicrobiae bacterium]|jgi:aryl-alcohol dehydrogenase-like predicted oxidoreductase|nr:aldo/keto reductase [Verrucomicrobiae bacterium]
MDVTRTAFGAWNGGRFMNYGEPLPDEQWISLVRRAFDQGIRTFVTADVYGSGGGDELLGSALAGLPRQEYCLVGAVGHDFYKGQRQGSRGFPRFTDPGLRPPRDYADYLRMAAEKSLARCRAEKFDLLLLHNPDSIGYSSDHVWSGMDKLIDAKLTDRIGIAPGPANGFTLDLLLCFERFGPLLDWAMIILNPLEPWPGRLVLPAAAKNDIQLLTRVVDYGGLFHDDVKAGHKFGAHDHRSFRPAGWVEAGNGKLGQIRSVAEKHNLTLLQLACVWNLSQPPVKSVVPTLIQEVGNSKPIESKLDELASLPDVSLNEEELELIGRIGNNRGCMALKGASRSHTTAPEADRWSITADLEAVGKRWGIDPDQDLAFSHAGQQ